MTVNQIAEQEPFTTADGSTIRSILDCTNAPVENQSLAEANLSPGGSTQKHYHKISEEFYFILEGSGTIQVGDDKTEVVPGDAVLIPKGEWHQITAGQTTELRFLCCCAPPYSHEDTFFE